MPEPHCALSDAAGGVQEVFTCVPESGISVVLKHKSCSPPLPALLVSVIVRTLAMRRGLLSGTSTKHVPSVNGSKVCSELVKPTPQKHKTGTKSSAQTLHSPHPFLCYHPLHEHCCICSCRRHLNCKVPALCAHSSAKGTVTVPWGHPYH